MMKNFNYFRYLSQMPNCIWLEGLITEDQTKAGDPTYGMWVGWHGFQNAGWTLLHNFPMWTVLEGATTGCLRPIKVDSANTSGNFIFVSGLLDPKKFCEFDINNNIIEDPTKYFICNLPVAGVFTPITNNQKITFQAGAANFKNWFTTAQRDKILTYVNAKNWILTW